MGKRKIPLVTDKIYHIYNRGVAGCKIFKTNRDYQRFLETVYHYHFFPEARFSTAQIRTRSVNKGPIKGKKLLLPEKTENPLVEIIAYCLMPTHYHLILKQAKNNGITDFMKKTGGSYSQYFNLKHERFGPLLQGKFKSILVENDQQLIHLSRYIHINPSESSKVKWGPKQLRNYPWSSFRVYLGLKDEKICLSNKKLISELILEHFKSPREYENFVLAQVSTRESKIVEGLTIDDNPGWFSL